MDIKSCDGELQEDQGDSGAFEAGGRFTQFQRSAEDPCEDGHQFNSIDSQAGGGSTIKTWSLLHFMSVLHLRAVAHPLHRSLVQAGGGGLQV